MTATKGVTFHNTTKYTRFGKKGSNTEFLFIEFSFFLYFFILNIFFVLFLFLNHDLNILKFDIFFCFYSKIMFYCCCCCCCGYRCFKIDFKILIASH